MDRWYRLQTMKSDPRRGHLRIRVMCVSGMTERITVMNATMLVALGGLLVVAPLAAQERKPVPKDSVRVSIAGCAKGYAFTTSHRTDESSDGAGFPEGMHLRMNGPKKTMGDIKAHRGSMIEITG